MIEALALVVAVLFGVTLLRATRTSTVERGAAVGPGTKAWGILRAGSQVGRDCIIGRNAYVDAGAIVGDRVKIQNNALIYSGVTIDDGAFIGPAAVITNDRRPRSLTTVGRLARPGDWELTRTRIGKGASIGAGAIVVAGNDVGDWAIVGAGAVVTHAVPDFAMVVGVPARILGWACVCGWPLVGPTGIPLGPTWTGWVGCRCGRQFELNDGLARRVVHMGVDLGQMA